jgi:hypothetical protein
VSIDFVHIDGLRVWDGEVHHEFSQLQHAANQLKLCKSGVERETGPRSKPDKLMHCTKAFQLSRKKHQDIQKENTTTTLQNHESPSHDHVTQGRTPINIHQTHPKAS